MIGIHITVIISVLLLIRLAFPRKFGNVPLFTYWLLRKLKETKGDVTLGELQEHLQKYVDYTATNRLNLESGQKPTVQASPTLGTDWRTIRLR